MSGRLNPGPAAHTVVRCSRVSEDGPCGREQAIESHGAGDGVRIAIDVSGDLAAWLASFGWRREHGRWLCPFCADSLGGLL